MLDLWINLEHRESVVASIVILKELVKHGHFIANDATCKILHSLDLVQIGFRFIIPYYGTMKDLGKN